MIFNPGFAVLDPGFVAEQIKKSLRKTMLPTKSREAKMRPAELNAGFYAKLSDECLAKMNQISLLPRANQTRQQRAAIDRLEVKYEEEMRKTAVGRRILRAQYLASGFTTADFKRGCLS